MKTETSPTPRPPSETDIRDYAYHLYEQRGRVPGHELDDWLEAEACLATGERAVSPAADETAKADSLQLVEI